MANNKNLIPGAHRLTVEEQSRGGKKSGEVRRERQQLRQAAAAVLSGSFTDSSGNTMTGQELIIKQLGEVLQNTNHKYWLDVLQLLVKLTDSDINQTEFEAIEEQQTALLLKARQERELLEMCDTISSSLKGVLESE